MAPQSTERHKLVVERIWPFGRTMPESGRATRVPSSIAA